MKDFCQHCGHVHGSDDARAVKRFSAVPKFVARHGRVQRDTRAEAERDECAWRVNKNARHEEARP